MSPHSFVGLDQNSHHIAKNFLPYDFPPKLVVEFLKDFHAAFPTSLSWSSNITSFINWLSYLRSNKYPFFDFNISYFGKFFRYLNPTLFWSIALMQYFMNPIFIYNRGKYTFSGLSNGAFTTFFYSGVSFSRQNVTKFSVPTCQYVPELAQSDCLWLGSHAYCLCYD